MPHNSYNLRLFRDYYTSLEADFIATRRYVEIDTRNFDTFSVEYTKLLLALGSEVDVVTKLLAQAIDPTGKFDNLPARWATITKKFSSFTQAFCDPGLGYSSDGKRLVVIPWKDWTKDNRPGWWTAYNHVKHDRHTYYHDANLRHTIRALAGLYTALQSLHTLNDPDLTSIKSDLFKRPYHNSDEYGRPEIQDA